MRVCDKCEVRLLYATFKNMRDSTEIDLCIECYGLFSDWVHNLNRKKENDPVIPGDIVEEKAISEIIKDKPKKEVTNARRRKR